MSSMTTADAARVLGVTRQQVQNYVQAGTLTLSGRVGSSYLVDTVSVQRLAIHEHRRGRPMNQNTAWATIAILSGHFVSWLDSSSVSRLKARLRKMSSAEIRWATRKRGDVLRFRASESFLGDLREGLILTGVSALNSGDFHLTEIPNVVEGYTNPKGLEELIDYYSLVRDENGNVIVHVTGFELEDVQKLRRAVTAMDLADSLDVRERSRGLDMVEQLRKSL